MKYKETDIDKLSNDELLQAHKDLKAIEQKFRDKQLDPRYIKKFKSIPEINPVFADTQAAILSEINRRAINIST